MTAPVTDSEDSGGSVLAFLHRMDKKQDVMMAELARLARAFPDNDPDAHRRYHEAEIRRVEARAAFMEKMAFELTRYGLIGFSGWALWQLWTAFLHGPAR